MDNFKNRFLWPFLLIALLVSCGSDAVYGDEAVLVGTVYVSCSKECKIHGSCGQSEVTGKEVILLGEEPAFPGASSINFQGLTAGNIVEIIDTKVVAGLDQQSNKEIEIRFYAVQDQDSETNGWAPGFCIANANE